MLVTAFPVSLHAQASRGASPPTSDLQPPPSELRGLIERYSIDRGSLIRSYPVSLSPARQARFRQLYSEWLALLQKMDFEALSQDDKVDYLLFRNHLEHELRQLDIQSRQMAEIESLVPFTAVITNLEEARRRMEPIDSAKVAALLTDLRKQIDERRKAVEAGLKTETSRAGDEKIAPLKAKKTSANRAILVIAGLKMALKNWYTFYDGYDPVFTCGMKSRTKLSISH